MLKKKENERSKKWAGPAHQAAHVPLPRPSSFPQCRSASVGQHSALSGPQLPLSPPPSKSSNWRAGDGRIKPAKTKSSRPAAELTRRRQNQHVHKETGCHLAPEVKPGPLRCLRDTLITILFSHI
jgi:hypothetical protein